MGSRKILDSQSVKQRDLELVNEQAAQEAREIEEEEALREADEADADVSTVQGGKK